MGETQKHINSVTESLMMILFRYDFISLVCELFKFSHTHIVLNNIESHPTTTAARKKHRKYIKIDLHKVDLMSEEKKEEIKRLHYDR